MDTLKLKVFALGAVAHLFVSKCSGKVIRQSKNNVLNIHQLFSKIVQWSCVNILQGESQGGP